MNLLQKTIGIPNVCSMTKVDLDNVYDPTGKKVTNYYPEDDEGDYLDFEQYKELLAIPCKAPDDKYATYWLATANGDPDDLWNVYYDGYISFGNGSGVQGIRPVVTLVPNVKFTPAEQKTNDTTTWDISI